MPMRNVVLTDRQDALINSLVASGEYRSASEVLSQGLQLIEEQNLRRAIDLGVADLDEGRFTAVSSEEIRSLVAKLADEAHEAAGHLNE